VGAVNDFDAGGRFILGVFAAALVLVYVLAFASADSDCNDRGGTLVRDAVGLWFECVERK
jgi:hypothetical protein